MNVTVIILAAGQGTRMKSALPKMLHLLNGRPLIHYSLKAASGVSDQPPVVVIGHGAETVQQAAGQAARFVLQEQQLGTGHAVLAAEPLLKGQDGLFVIIYGDMPLVTVHTLQRLVELQMKNQGPLTILVNGGDAPRGFGRVVRNFDNSVGEIIEEAQASPEVLALREYNSGIYCVKAEWLFGALHRVKISPKGEYYLTDIVGIAAGDGLRVEALVLEDNDEVIGINTRVHLADAERVLRRRVNHAFMEAGVSMIDPDHTYIEAGVEIGRDTTLWPNTYLRGRTVIGEGCEIGPNTIITDTTTGNRCTILATIMKGAQLDDDVDTGPFAHLRKGAHLCKGVHMGNFGEIKNSTLAPGTKMGHFSYIGDAIIGEDVNIGAGTITCNYDGAKKHKTEIGDGAFIGSDTMLVAPVKIGEGARTGAGAVVTHDVAPGEVVVGVPARPLKKAEKRD
jgi:bifunctional UDP-N-acetylglucosamine pyrophosphorylase/glucosamine-1-phosphate N-acetyltransferase